MEEIIQRSEELAEGAFLSSLKRNNSQIRKDRAASIADVAQLKYKRAIEDLGMLIKNQKRDQENMLDMSPTNAQSLIVASDFDADSYVAKDLKLGVDIRNNEIKLQVAIDRYEYLFGERL